MSDKKPKTLADIAEEAGAVRKEAPADAPTKIRLTDPLKKGGAST